MSDRKDAQAAGITLTVQRGLEVLRAFRADRVPLSNADLVRRTGLSKATVSRITTTLIWVGYLRRVSEGRKFELSAGALGVGHAFLEGNRVTRSIDPYLQALADRLEMSVALAIPNRLDMLYVACKTSPKIVTLRLGVGTLVPMESTAVGRAYLASLTVSERQSLMGAILAVAGPTADTIRENLDAALRELQATGVCTSVGEYERNAFGLAMPLTLGRSHTLMSLNCGGIAVSLDMKAMKERVVPQLKSTARKVIEVLADVECPT